MLKRLITLSTLAAGLFVLALSLSSPLPSVGAQGKDKNEHGRKLFAQYCASCHGVDGKGNGPAAASLKNKLMDLTLLEKRDGKFNAVHIQNIIEGEKEMLGHGNKDMPVWGTYFRNKRGSTYSFMNVNALTRYLKSIQQQ